MGSRAGRGPGEPGNSVMEFSNSISRLEQNDMTGAFRRQREIEIGVSGREKAIGIARRDRTANGRTVLPAEGVWHRRDP